MDLNKSRQEYLLTEIRRIKKDLDRLWNNKNQIIIKYTRAKETAKDTKEIIILQKKIANQLRDINYYINRADNMLGILTKKLDNLKEMR